MNQKTKNWEWLVAALILSLGPVAIPQQAYAMTAVSGTGTSVTIDGVDYDITYNAGDGVATAGSYATAIGESANAQSSYSVALGYNAMTGADNGGGEGSIAIGWGSIAGRDSDGGGHQKGIAIGVGASAVSDYAIAIGSQSSSGESGSGGSLGLATTAGGHASLAIGNESVSYGNFSIAIGPNSSVYTHGSLALGYNAVAGDESEDEYTNYEAIAIGSNAKATAKSSTALGDEAEAYGESGTALGVKSKAAATSSIGIGDNAETRAAYGIAIGADAVAGLYDDDKQGENGVAIGSQAWVLTAKNAVAVGYQSVALEDNTFSVGSDGSKITIEGDDGTEEVETPSITRRIVNVSNGKNNTDAATYGQLVNAQAVTTTTGEGEEQKTTTTYTPYEAGSDGLVTVKTNDGATAFTFKIGTGTDLISYDATNKQIILGNSEKTANTVKVGSSVWGHGSGGAGTVIGGISNQATAGGAEYGYWPVVDGFGGETITVYGSIALGRENAVNMAGGMAVGYKNTVTRQASVVVGNLNEVTGDVSTVIGTKNIVTAGESGALGDLNKIYGTGYAIGERITIGALDDETEEPVYGKGEDTYALGKNIIATGNNSVVLGYMSSTDEDYVVSVGGGTMDGTTVTRRITNVSNGTKSTDAATYGQLINAQAVKDENEKITDYTTYEADGDGVVTVKTNDGGTAFKIKVGTSGDSSTSYNGSDTITIGTDNKKISVTNMAMSTTGANLGATAGGENSFAIGGSANASGNQSVALGYQAVAGGAASEETLEGATVAIGATASATGNGSVALGYGAATTGNDAVALGSTAQAAAKDSGAIGSHARAYNTGAMAFGAESIAYGEGSATLGYNAFAGGARSLALGNEAKAGYYIDGNYYGGGDSAVAIGDNSWAIGNYNVAIGYGAAAGISSDYQTLVVGGTAIGLGAGAFGEGATAIGDGGRANNQGATAIGLNTYSDADFSTSIGFTAQVQGESGTAIGYQAIVGSDKGIKTEYGNKVSTVSFGHQKDDTYYESNAIGGFDAKKYTDTVLARLTNVADGKVNTDAATYGQIIKSQALGTDANTGLVTKVTPYTFENGVATIYTNNGGIAFQLEMPSGTISTEDGTTKGDGYITGKEVANELALKKADGTDYTGTYAQTGKTTGQNLAALDSQVVQNTSDISTLKTQVSGFDSKINGVKLADSDLEFDFSGGKTSVTQNVNYSDGTSKAFSITISGISGGVDSAVIGDTTKLSDKGLGDNVTDSILSVNDKLVKEGTYTAANGKVEVKNNAGNVAFTIDGLAVSSADVGDTSKLSAAGLGDNVTDSILSVNDKVGSLSDDINKVGAGAAALAALRPEGFDPDDKWSFAVGYGHYKNANAGALGAFFKPNADTTVSLGGTIGNGDPMMNAGVSFKLGSRSKKAGTYLDTRELVQRMDRMEGVAMKQNARIDAQDRIISMQMQRIEALEAQVAMLMQKAGLTSAVQKSVVR